MNQVKQDAEIIPDVRFDDANQQRELMEICFLQAGRSQADDTQESRYDLVAQACQIKVQEQRRTQAHLLDRGKGHISSLAW